MGGTGDKEPEGDLDGLQWGADGAAPTDLPLPDALPTWQAAESRPTPAAIARQVAPEVAEAFALEAEDHLRAIGSGLAGLEAEPGNRELLEDVRRSVHTLKGAAGVGGLAAVARLAHRMEDLLDRLYEGALEVSPDAIELLLATTDVVESLAGGVEEGAVGGIVERLYARFTGLLGEAEAGEPAVFAARVGESLRTQGSALGQIVRVQAERLDEIVGLVDELARVGDEEPDAPRVRRRLLDLIRGKLARVRLVPLGALNPRLHGAVRVVAAQQGKVVELALDGEEIELDTLVLTSLADPLLHLLRNAVSHGIERPDARRAAGKPECGRILLGARRDGAGVRLAVSDDGAGLDPAALRTAAVEGGYLSSDEAASMSDDSALSLVFRHGLSTAREVGEVSGRGVGLDVVRAHVTGLRGTLAVASLPGRGTTFTIRLPDGGAAGSALRVLVVDDSYALRVALSNLIEGAGWRPVVARDGLEALEVLRSGPDLPDAVLLDVEMPRMNGYEVLQALRADESFRALPVVLLTALTSEEDRRKALDLGASAHVAKPFDEAALVDLVRRLTGTT